MVISFGLCRYICLSSNEDWIWFELPTKFWLEMAAILAHMESGVLYITAELNKIA